MVNFAEVVLNVFQANCVIGEGDVLTKRQQRIFAVCFGVTL